MASLQSNLKIITSNTAPTTENLQKGAMAFGKVDDEYKIYGNSTGTEVHEFLALSPEDQAKLANVPENTNQALNGKLDSTAINNIYPLKVDTAPTVGIGSDKTDPNTDITSLAIGNNAKAGNFLSDESSYSTALGNYSTANGSFSTALGYNSSATGGYSTALGYNSTASGYFSTALGYNSGATGYYSTALGYGSTANGSNSTALGNSSNASGSSSTAVGYNSNASGSGSTVLGGSSTASGYNSTVLGFNSSATGESSVAIGNGSRATEAKEFSVGNINRTRRITHVTDPTNDQDAATKKYVDNAIQSAINNLVNGEEVSY